jgi:glutathione S-transferase
MEFGSAILADIWRLETATDAATYAAARTAVAAKFASVEAVLYAGPYFAGSRFRPEYGVDQADPLNVGT